jgi:hypothetical protein
MLLRQHNGAGLSLRSVTQRLVAHPVTLSAPGLPTVFHRSGTIVDGLHGRGLLEAALDAEVTEHLRLRQARPGRARQPQLA